VHKQGAQCIDELDELKSLKKSKALGEKAD